MAGSMRQRGRASWQIRAFVGTDPVAGRRRYVERTIRGGRREAQKALAALVLETEQLTPRAAAEGTLEALSRAWLAHAAPSLSPRTVEVTRSFLEQPIIPALGAIPVSRLTAADLDRFYRRLLEFGGPRGPYAPATVRRVHGILRRVLDQGVRWGWASRNPASLASPPRVPHRQLVPPAPADVARLLAVARDVEPDFAFFILLAASSGARRGELLALRQGDIDLASCALRIERGIVLAEGSLVEHGTKTHQSRRVSLDALVSRELEGHLARQRARAALHAESLASDGFLFSYVPDASLPWRPDSVSRSFRRLCVSAGVDGVRLHDLRHYVATRLLAAGVDVRTVAGRLGHRNASTTLDVYAHFLPGADVDAARLLGAELQLAIDGEIQSGAANAAADTAAEQRREDVDGDEASSPEAN